MKKPNTLTVTIPDAQWHELAKTLRDDAEMAFDYLVTIVGMDWKDSLGCIYYLDSTTHNTHIPSKSSPQVTARLRIYILSATSTPSDASMSVRSMTFSA